MYSLYSSFSNIFIVQVFNIQLIYFSKLVSQFLFFLSFVFCLSQPACFLCFGSAVSGPQLFVSFFSVPHFQVFSLSFWLFTLYILDLSRYIFILFLRIFQFHISQNYKFVSFSQFCICDFSELGYFYVFYFIYSRIVNLIYLVWTIERLNRLLQHFKV